MEDQTMSDKVCRWGILGTAGIARKNWRGIRLSGNAEVAAVASRSVDSAQRFIDECSSQVPTVRPAEALGSYDALLARDDIDAVYIPLPTALRHQWVVKAAEAGKHVLGEKPAALNAELVADMLEVCKKNNVQYMDGVMFMHSQRLPLLRSLLDAGEIGNLKRMSSQFSFYGDEDFQTNNIRTNSSLEPFGCLGDLGWYCIRYFLNAMQGQMPTQVIARTLSQLQGTGSPDPVPGQFSADLLFPGGVSANFYCSFVTENQQWFHASGDKGNLRMDDFVLPYHGSEAAIHVNRDHFEVDNCVFHMENHSTRHSVPEYDAGASSAQEVRMVRHFSDMVLNKRHEPIWPEWTLKTQTILDACFQSAGNGGVPVDIAAG